MRNKVVGGAVALAFLAGFGTDALVNARLAAAAADFPVETDIGAGEPSQLLIDNTKIRVTMVNFKKGTTRTGNVRRRSDQLIIYVDNGHLKTQPVPGQAPGFDNYQDPRNCNTPIGCGPVGPDGKRAGNTPSGTVAFRPKNSIAQALDITDDYRALYVEFK
jgi:hypothetical protein